MGQRQNENTARDNQERQQRRILEAAETTTGREETADADPEGGLGYG